MANPWSMRSLFEQKHGTNIIFKSNIIYDSKGAEVSNPTTSLGMLLSVVVAGLYGRQRIVVSRIRWIDSKGNWHECAEATELALTQRAECALAIIPKNAWREYHSWLSGSKQRQAAYDADSVSSARDFVAYRTLKELID